MITRRQSRNPRQYGHKGGAGPTAGKRAITYRAQLPDGRIVRKRSYHVDQPTAYLGIYEHQGVWYFAGITAAKTAADEPDYGCRNTDGTPRRNGQRAIVAHRT